MCVALKQLLVFNASLHKFLNAKIHKAGGNAGESGNANTNTKGRREMQIPMGGIF